MLYQAIFIIINTRWMFVDRINEKMSLFLHREAGKCPKWGDRERRGVRERGERNL